MKVLTDTQIVDFLASMSDYDWFPCISKLNKDYQYKDGSGYVVTASNNFRELITHAAQSPSIAKTLRVFPKQS